MAYDYRPATDAELQLLHENGFALDAIKIKSVDDRMLVAENYKTGHEIWIIRGHCKKWL